VESTALEVGLVEGGCDSGDGTVELLAWHGIMMAKEARHPSIECDCATIPRARFERRRRALRLIRRD
jgi:hypothetical protein